MISQLFQCHQFCRYVGSMRNLNFAAFQHEKRAAKKANSWLAKGLGFLEKTS